jgi:predicted transcriptional regulator
MVIMYKMTPEKKEKINRKLDKMMDFIEELKECVDESENYDEGMAESSYRGGSAMSMRGRYGYRRGM